MRPAGRKYKKPPMEKKLMQIHLIAVGKLTQEYSAVRHRKVFKTHLANKHHATD